MLRDYLTHSLFGGRRRGCRRLNASVEGERGHVSNDLKSSLEGDGGVVW